MEKLVFKIGDKLKCVYTEVSLYTINKIYYLEYIDKFNNYYYVKADDGLRDTFNLDQINKMFKLQRSIKQLPLP